MGQLSGSVVTTILEMGVHMRMVCTFFAVVSVFLLVCSTASFACENGDQKTSNDGRTLICICDRDGNCHWAGG